MGKSNHRLLSPSRSRPDGVFPIFLQRAFLNAPRDYLMFQFVSNRANKKMRRMYVQHTESTEMIGLCNDGKETGNDFQPALLATEQFNS